MTFGSLFAGIGGMDLGLERAGMECQWQVEIDPFCRRVLEKHWPQVRRYEDVRTVHGEAAHVADATSLRSQERQSRADINGSLGGIRATCEACLPAVDLLCGGFPCQPHSLAGRRQGSADERDLWGEFARLICEVRPRWVLAENVPGLLSSEAGRFFGRVLRDLAACGYDAEWDCLPAAAVGAPHRRDRVWIVACANTGRWRLRGRGEPEAAQLHAPVGARQMAHPLHDGREERPVSEGQGREAVSDAAWGGGAGAYLADTNRTGLSQPWDAGTPGACAGGIFAGPGLNRRSWWATEPNVGRVAHGVPQRVDRLRSLGNAVVPQVVEWIGRRILAVEAAMGAA